MIEAVPVSWVQRNCWFCLPEMDLKAVQQNGRHQKTTKSELLLPVRQLFLPQSSLSGLHSSSSIETSKREACDVGICLFRIRLRMGLLLFGFSICLGRCGVCPLLNRLLNSHLPTFICDWLELSWKQEPGGEMFLFCLEMVPGVLLLWAKVFLTLGMIWESLVQKRVVSVLFYTNILQTAGWVQRMFLYLRV